MMDGRAMSCCRYLLHHVPGTEYYLAKTGSGLKITILLVEAHIAPGDGTWPTFSHRDVPFEVKVSL